VALTSLGVNLAGPSVTCGKAFQRAPRTVREDELFYLVLLIIFLIQFLVVLAALMFAVFLARPEVPFSAGGLSGSDYS